MGDAEYLAAFMQVVMPIAYEVSQLSIKYFDFYSNILR